MYNIAQILGTIGIVMICFSLIIGYIIKNPLVCILFVLAFMIAGCTCLCFMGTLLDSYRIVVPTIIFGLVMTAYYFTPEYKRKHLYAYIIFVICVLVIGTIINIWFMHIHNNDGIGFPYGLELTTVLSSIILMSSKAYACYEKDDVKESFYIAFAAIAIFFGLIFYTADLCLWIPLGISIGAIIYAILVVPMISVFLPSGNNDENTGKKTIEE